MSLSSTLLYIRNASEEEITIYNKMIEIVKNNTKNPEDPMNPDEYKLLQDTLIQKNKIWYDVLYGTFGFFDKIIR
jgi:hypothetical protein